MRLQQCKAIFVPLTLTVHSWWPTLKTLDKLDQLYIHGLLRVVLDVQLNICAYYDSLFMCVLSAPFEQL